MSIALQAEREAIRRYTELSDNMLKASNESAGALFKRLIIEEQEHERLLLKWMKKESISENPDIGPIKWHDPHISTTYDSDARDPSYSTPYRALAFAVHNEEIAFRFYTHVAANSEQEDIRQYAETLAREELGHAALLRAERRRSFHEERNKNIPQPELAAKDIHNVVDLLAVAAHTSEYVLQKLNNLSFHTSEISPVIDKLTALNRQYKKKLANSIQQNSVSASQLITTTLYQLDVLNDNILKKQKNDELVLERVLEICDHGFSFYDNIVESTEDEDMMLTAQDLSSAALDHIDVIKQLLASRKVQQE